MKNLIALLLMAASLTISIQAQQKESQQDFESLEKGEDITKLQKQKFGTWGKSAWTVSEKESEGFNKSNKFASSDGEVNATLVQYKNLEVGTTYVFSVAVKITNADKPWKTNYAVNVTSGGKEDGHTYGKEEVKEPKQGEWKQHTIEFTVIEGKEKVTLHVYRWAKGVTLNVDDFMLSKK
jgi:hypothetical protein